MAQQGIPLDALPSVLKSSKVDPEGQAGVLQNARMLLIAETKRCFDEGRGRTGGSGCRSSILGCVGQAHQFLRDTGILMGFGDIKRFQNHVDREEGRRWFWHKCGAGQSADFWRHGLSKNKFLTIPKCPSRQSGARRCDSRMPKRLKWGEGKKGGIVYEVLTPKQQKSRRSRV